MRSYLTRLGIVIAFWASSAGTGAAQLDGNTDSISWDRSLSKFLREYEAAKDFPKPTDTRYKRVFVDLNSDGREEAIVFLTGRWWCGSGGCATLVLEAGSGQWKLIGSIVTTNTPIRVLMKKSNGWRSITVMAHHPGGREFEAELAFDGKKYPLSPTLPVLPDTKGHTVISSGDQLLPLH